MESSRAAGSELRSTVEDLQNRVSQANARFESAQKVQVDLEHEADAARKLKVDENVKIASKIAKFVPKSIFFSSKSEKCVKIRSKLKTGRMI